MKKLLKSVFKLNLWFCAGVLIMDTYGKVCDIHKVMCRINKTINNDNGGL